MRSFKVLAPYVTLKVKDLNGRTVVQGFLAEGRVNDPIEDEQFEKHVRTGLIEEIKDEPAPEPDPPADDVPRGNASREEWAAYAKDKKGAPDEETRPVEEGGLKQAELRDKYGK